MILLEGNNTMKHFLMVSSVLVGSLILVGCGASPKPVASGPSSISPSSSPGAESPSSASQSRSSTSPSASTPTTSSSTSSTRSSTVAGMTHIHYTAAQESKIFEVGKSAGLGYAFVPEGGFATHFTSVATYKTSSSPSHQVLELSYNNLLVQEAGAASALAGGGDQQSAKVSLVIPGLGSNAPQPGTWIEVHGIQGSGTRGVVMFEIHGVTVQVASSTLSKSQIMRIAESFAQI